jgi:hypothetical protein
MEYKMTAGELVYRRTKRGTDYRVNRKTICVQSTAVGARFRRTVRGLEYRRTGVLVYKRTARGAAYERTVGG